MHISEVFETEEDQALEKIDDILSQEDQGDLTVEIQGSILMTTTVKILVQKYHTIFLAPHQRRNRLESLL